MRHSNYILKREIIATYILGNAKFCSQKEMECIDNNYGKLILSPMKQKHCDLCKNSTDISTKIPWSVNYIHLVYHQVAGGILYIWPSLNIFFKLKPQNLSNFLCIVSFWHEINSISDDETGVENMCLCYSTCNYTSYTQDVSSAPYPDPEAGRDRILNTVFGSNPSDSHLCYAKYVLA